MRRTFVSFVVPLIAVSAVQAEGPRLEIHGGYDRLAYKNFFSPSDTTFKPINGSMYGVGLGYDFQVGEQLFVGAEGNADFSSKSRCQVNPLILAPGIFESCVNPKRDLSANARLGIKLGNERTALYALAGYSNLKLGTSFQINRSGKTPTGSETRDGVRLGAGIEQDFSDRFYGKIEYRYTSYGSRLNRNQGIVGIGIRF
jgi:outer membrane immunogenic protein